MRTWPLFQLRLTTPDLVLRLPTLDDLDALAELAAEGIHEPDAMPFASPWTDKEPEVRARATAQFHWNSWASWKPENWSCHFVVIHEGRVVGTQGVGARDFAVVREVHTGSWLGRRFHGRGIGTRMRAAVLHFAFVGLGAESAVSSAFTDNPASLAVSRKLGYRPDGITRQARRGAPATEQRLRLTRDDWERGQAETVSGPVRIENLEPCLPFFGLA
jgi:RimJ/RimL family protein N-acetyltransferase